jgi:hypothetical protein
MDCLWLIKTVTYFRTSRYLKHYLLNPRLLKPTRIPFFESKYHTHLLKPKLLGQLAHRLLMVVKDGCVL